MSSKITQVFRRTVFPTHFVSPQVQYLQSPRPYLPLSRTLKYWKSWEDLNQENKDLGQENKLLRNKLELHKYRYPKDKRRWMVNGTIENAYRNYVYFVDLEETNVPLLDMILRGEFVTLYGARASGKSTRVDQVMEKLKSQGVICIYVTFEQVNMETKDSFWSSLGGALHASAPKYFGKADVKSSDDFWLKFWKEQWNDNRVVLFIDEFDILREAHDDIKSSFLGVIRAIKNTKENYALLSLVAIGPFSILRLSSDRITTSPFNISNPFRNPNFTLEQVQTVFKEFEDDFNLTIDPEIIEDIYNRTNGHAALVCLCGKAINSDLMSKLDENRRLTSLTWSFKVASTLYVDGKKEKQVPQENVYNTELNRILVNWLVKNNGFEVTGQWHMVESHAKKHVHTYSDIVITTKRQRIVLELLATATKKDLDEHFERVLEYAEKLSADDIWIVHFTCEDSYATATHEKLHWPPDDRINVIHCFHNRSLENVLMNVRYVDNSGTIKYITDEAMPLNLS
ncbi:hypothetical protein RhiirB3_392248 [Rhizophagus irregularis]|nr:hypothetical protein RhiirB3_392248 [Rhizophagus irregularis]